MPASSRPTHCSSGRALQCELARPAEWPHVRGVWVGRPNKDAMDAESLRMALMPPPPIFASGVIESHSTVCELHVMHELLYLGS